MACTSSLCSIRTNFTYSTAMDSSALSASKASYVATETRPAQDTAMLYQCLITLLNQDAHNAIMLWNEEFYMAGFSSGLLLLGVIIQESHLDSNATTSVINLLS
jgi:hypothetical protein